MRAASSLIIVTIIVMLGIPAESAVAASEATTGVTVEASSRAKIRLSAIEEPAIDAAALGYELARTFLTQEQWDEKVCSIRKKFKDWEKDNDGNIGQYLNDRFIIVALGAVSGDTQKIKHAIIWLAFYKEFDQQVPTVVEIAMTKHRDSLLRLFADFSWEKASAYIKNKEWRSDAVCKPEAVLLSNRDKKGS